MINKLILWIQSQGNVMKWRGISDEKVELLIQEGEKKDAAEKRKIQSEIQAIKRQYIRTHGKPKPLSHIPLQGIFTENKRHRA